MKTSIKNKCRVSFLAACVVAGSLQAQLTVNTSVNADDLVSSIVGVGVTTANVSLNCANLAFATFAGGATTNIGLDEGILLTTGAASNAIGPNQSTSRTTVNGFPGDADLNTLVTPFSTFDACVLEFDFVPEAELLTVEYVFGSEEYPEFVCSIFNDVFAFYVTGPRPGGGMYDRENVVLIPGTTLPVAINTVNSGEIGASGSDEICDPDELIYTEFYVDNTGGLTIEYDGFTTLLTAAVALVPGASYSFKFAIADAGDFQLDSGVFIKASSFVSFQCDAGEVALNTMEQCFGNASLSASTTSVKPGGTYAYVVTDNDLQIVAISESEEISLAGIPIGQYLLWGLSWGGELSGAEVGGNAADLASNVCFELSNAVEFEIIDCGVVEPGECTNWRYFLSDNLPSGNVSNIYEVSLDDVTMEATLTLLTTVAYRSHIAYDGDKQLLYIVRNPGGAFQTLDVSVPGNIPSAPIALSMSLGGTPAAGVDANGDLYIGSESQNKIYKVDPITGTAIFHADAPITGGDLAFDESGQLYVATRGNGGQVWKINPGGSNTLFSSIPADVTGGAFMENGNGLISRNGRSRLFTSPTLSFNPNSFYKLRLNGASFTTGSGGDLASGCTKSEPVVELCQNFRTYYYNFISSNDGQLFEVAFSNGTATYTELSNFTVGDNHIALDSLGIIYSVRGSVIDIYDPFTQTYTAQNIAIVDNATNASLSGFPAAVIDKAGTLWLARSSNNTVYTVEFTGGQARATAQFNAADGILVKGGDLVVTEDEAGNETLWLANRTDNILYNLSAGGSIALPVTEVNGVSTTVDGQLLLANGLMNANGGLYTWNPFTGDLLQLSNVGGPVSFFNGDLASRCLDSKFVGCLDYQTYYTGYPTSSVANELFRVEVAAGEATFTKVNGFSTADNHIGISSDGLIYAVRGNMVDIFNPATESYVDQNIPIKSVSGQSISGIPAVTMDRNNQLWVGRSTNNTVYSIEFIGGEAIATVRFTGTPISGGDLIWTFGEDETGAADVLWHINRSNNTLYNFNDGSSVVIALPEINGASVLEDGRLLFANGQAGAAGGLYAYDVAEGTLEQLTSIGGPNVFFNGDLAGGCVSAEPAIIPQSNFNTPRIVSDASTRLQNFPNPTEGMSTVVFETAAEERTVLQVFDATGREVSTLFNQVTQPGVEYRVQFDAGTLPIGIYIYRLSNGTEVKVSKFMVGR